VVGGAMMDMGLLYGSLLSPGSTWLQVDVSEIEELNRMARLELGE